VHYNCVIYRKGKFPVTRYPVYTITQNILHLPQWQIFIIEPHLDSNSHNYHSRLSELKQRGIN